MIDQIYLLLYNLLFTLLPPLALGIYDRVAKPCVLLSAPELYRRGRLELVYQPHSFWLTIADALYQSVVIFFVTEEVSVSIKTIDSCASTVAQDASKIYHLVSCVLQVYHNSTIDIWEFGTTIM